MISGRDYVLQQLRWPSTSGSGITKDVNEYSKSVRPDNDDHGTLAAIAYK